MRNKSLRAHLDGDPTDGVVQNVWVQGIGCGTALTQFS
jgi:hypothetical protein